MNVLLNIRANRVATGFAEKGNLDEVDATARYISTRKEAHDALDKVLNALGLEDE